MEFRTDGVVNDDGVAVGGQDRGHTFEIDRDPGGGFELHDNGLNDMLRSIFR